MPAQKEKIIGVTAFKAKCLGLVNEIAKGKTAKVTLTRRGKPVAEITAPRKEKRVKKPSLHGALSGMMTLDPSLDLTEPTSRYLDWDPENVKLYNE